MTNKFASAESGNDKKVVSREEFNKRVEMESDWIRRHEYEQERSRAWELAKHRISQEYRVR